MAGGGQHGYMGGWGDKVGAKQRGIITYSVSPYAQKPFAGALHNAIFNTFRRVSSQAFYVVLPAGLLIYVVNSAKQKNAYLYSKAGREDLEALM
ncbi:cytochrome b-c1 complex subunit 8 [Lipomyces chichibuensis]|uniref:cytochrome b-c1 complex subunit 8 n=1 Tax=Lipomyces chichibuensis TaxID=1546026 RepID=UPI0033439008